ncbi:response regulator transcription factor [Cellulomonas sp. URHE0023]|uniref:response regulator n=1 Tax=Cellulomonas sp. URHE0023 TaxID=1380354 RepID=UPI00048688A0|nr:response regulator transcription factor [Cellulomonas sp. URHE0023]
MIRVLLADDQDLVRAGLRMILESQDDLEVVGEAGTGEDAVRLSASERPDVVVMDIRMPGLDGLEATRRILAAPGPWPHVLMLTTFDSDEYLRAALSAGAAGFLLKTAPPNRLIDGVRVVAAGEALLAPALTRRLIADYLGYPATNHAGRLAALTPREVEVLELMARGLSNTQIAAALHVGDATVKTHVNRLFQKLAVRDRVQAVIVAYECGLAVRPTA